MRSEQEFTGIVRQYLNMVYRIALLFFENGSSNMEKVVM